MAAKLFPTSWPVINLRSFGSLEAGYKTTRDAFRAIEELRKRITEVGNDHGSRLTPTTGVVAPATTPTDVGLFYLDTVLKDMYISVGTASSADWKKITP